MALMRRREFIARLGGAIAAPAFAWAAKAQAYPARPVRIMVGFPPAGNNDIHARIIAQWLSERLGQQFIVENRSGAGGSVATEAVVRAKPDGYTLLQAASNDSWNATLYDNLRYDFVRDTEPVASVTLTSGVLVVHPSLPVKSVGELIGHLKAHPGLAVGSAGIGSAPHVYWQLFQSMSGVDTLHVPYRGGGPAMNDLLGGQILIYFATIPSSIGHIRAGRLRALAVTTATRSEALPDIPTVGEFVPGYEASGWQGVVAPRNTPSGIVKRLNEEINAALADPRIKERFAQLGATPFANSPAAFGRFIVEYTEKWATVIRSANIRAE
jgi:tripartite-type tricarboxylate transporter receptor subunit TctC